jgi:hypothetical protein
MIGKEILHYKILEKLGEALLCLSFVGLGGLVRRFILRNFSEGGSHFKLGVNL